MVKPTPKKEVAVDWASESDKIVFFYSTPDALSDFISFGNVAEWTRENYYRLRVDSRFDFNEVLEYIQNYGSDVS